MPLVAGAADTYGRVRDAEKPLTARECADWMGFNPEWIRCAITEGVKVKGTIVKLDAETLAVDDRRKTHRIYLDSFITFLIAIGWKRLPRSRSEPALPRARVG